MGKGVPTVMLVHRIAKFLTIFLFWGNFLFAQDIGSNAWGFAFAPGISKSKPGAGIDYPGPPYYVDLKVSEPFLSCFKGELFRQAIGAKKWFKCQAIGYSTYNYLINFDYDMSASIADNLSDRYAFQFVYLTHRLGRSFDFHNVKLIPYAGLSFNYLVGAKWIVTWQPGAKEFDLLNSYDRWNVGWEIGTGIQISLNNKIDLLVRPAYTQLLKAYEPNVRKLYAFDFGFGLVLKK